MTTANEATSNLTSAAALARLIGFQAFSSGAEQMNDFKNLLPAAARFTGRLRASQERAVPPGGLSFSGFQLAERYVLGKTSVERVLL